jgi:hypothetical protein
MFCLVWPIALGAMAISQAKQYETKKACPPAGGFYQS